MKHDTKDKTEIIKVSKAGMLSFVASQLKGKVLFQKKMDEAKKMLKHARIVK